LITEPALPALVSYTNGIAVDRQIRRN